VGLGHGPAQDTSIGARRSASAVGFCYIHRPLDKPSVVLAVLLALITLAAAAPARGAVVWAVDDGEKIPRDAAHRPSPCKTGALNPVWRPGQPIRLFALRDEVVAFQVVVEADSDDRPLTGVTVELAPLAGPGDDGVQREAIQREAIQREAIQREAIQREAIQIDRFVEHFFDIPRPSAQNGERYSLGWAAGSGPPPDRFTGAMPDALIPVDIAPPWSPYPMRIAPGQNGVVWIDLTVPADQAPGVYRGQVMVRAGEQTLANLPIELDVMDATLPARPVDTMLFYDVGALTKRIGDRPAAERQLWTLFHAHRVAPLHGVESVDDVRAQLAALDGSLYTPEKGYPGPAAGIGDGIIVLGTYGTFGDPSPEKARKLEAIADELAAHALFDRADVVLYAEDEDCRSPRGAGWRALLAGSPNQNLRRVRVAWTCSEDPTTQPVDVPIVIAGTYDTGWAAGARAAGKQTWIYNGQRPATGALLTDTPAIELRTSGWIAAMAGIPRWFIWETTAWYDANHGGLGPYDPFASAETFHNRHGEAAMGDGVMVYPGRQVDQFQDHSVGFAGVLPSIRLKNLRRGIQDAGYYQLARGAATAEANAIARELLPRILGEARLGKPVSWDEHGQRFFDARRRLATLIVPGADPGPRGDMGVGDGGRRPLRPFRLRTMAAAALVAILVIAVAARRLWRRRAR